MDPTNAKRPLSSTPARHAGVGHESPDGRTDTRRPLREAAALGGALIGLVAAFFSIANPNIGVGFTWATLVFSLVTFVSALHLWHHSTEPPHRRLAITAGLVAALIVAICVSILVGVEETGGTRSTSAQTQPVQSAAASASARPDNGQDSSSAGVPPTDAPSITVVPDHGRPNDSFTANITWPDSSYCQHFVKIVVDGRIVGDHFGSPQGSTIASVMFDPPNVSPAGPLSVGKHIVTAVCGDRSSPPATYTVSG
jgi:hypothetical protein